MSFLHPLALLGLAAAALPALLHLFQRRTPPELDFPPLRYLSEAERQSARRLKLRHLLLLLLRTTLIVVVVLAAARPLVPGVRGAEGGGGSAHQPTALVVILDNSPSSGAVVDGRPVLDRLRDAAHASLARSTSADRVWLVLADGVVRGGSREALLASVDNTTSGWVRLDLVAAVDRAARLVLAEPLPGHEVHVLSDLQRTALAVGRADAPRMRGVRVLALAAGRPVANRGIGAVRVAEGAAVVSIAGSDDTEPALVTIRLRGRDVGRALATPQTGGGAAVVSVTVPPQLPGWWAGEAVLEPDELRADDRRPFVWHVAPPVRVEAAPASGPFVAAALAVLREGRRVAAGRDVVIGDAPGPGRSVVLPPADPALVGQANRALAARGVPWHWGAPGTPGPVASADLGMIGGVQVTRRYRLDGAGEVLATVNGEPWLVRAGEIVLLGSRPDTAWTALPAAPGFVPFLDALVNRVVAGEAEVAEAEGAPRVEFRLRGADTVGATLFAPDARESDLTPATPEQATAALGGAEVLDDRRFALERFAGTRRADASGALLVLALLLAAAELGVATLTR